MTSDTRRTSADDLLILLAVGRSGRFVAAAEELGLNHTTISRRIAALEQSVGGRLLARAAGGWELTDLGREALAAAEAVEAANWPAASPPRCANPSRPRMSSSTSRRLEPPQASAYCRASWPTDTTIWSECSPKPLPWN